MKFTPGPIGADFSGSIGSTTASRNRFGPYLRTKAIPVNPNTIRQQAVRTLFATLVNNWLNALTAAQRAAWEEWAANTTILGKDGSPINITGQNAYIRFNTPQLQIGAARVDTAPTVFNNGNPPTGYELTATGTNGSIGILSGLMSTTVRVDGLATIAGRVIMQMSAPVNPSINFFKGPYQFSSFELIAAAANGRAFDNSLASLAQATTPVAGTFRSLRVRVAYDDGRLSETFQAIGLIEEDS